MKITSSLRWLPLAALYLFFSLALSAQNGHSRLLPLFGKKTHVTADCNNDVTAPELHCPAGNCLPTARAAYLSSTTGEPWGLYDNINAMDAVFGSGNWDHLYLENTDVTTLLTPAYKVIFLEGSYYGGYALDGFLTTNLPALENWVNAGGALFINCATVNSPSNLNFGFGGVLFQSKVSGFQVAVQAPLHPIFNGPFIPANGDFYGNEFQYGTISGNSGLTLLTSAAAGICLSEKKWGAGKVFFGCILTISWDGPQPNVQNMWKNILADLNALCNNNVVLPAEVGSCTATVAAQALDATATDDCALASLTHNFAAATVNTALSGAVFSTTPTLVRWTATDATGNTSTCEFLVSVHEPEAPVITCPGDRSVPADAGACGSVVNFPITATDNCTAVPTIVATPASGSSFVNGTTTVLAEATDESGNRSTCSFVVTVVANPELCNGLDDDCNGLIDDGAPADNIFYADTDGDGYGDPNHSVAACFAPPGYVSNLLDCNDANYYIQPGVGESCNGIDDNCDGSIDEGVTPTWYADTDGDGYGDPNVVQLACSQPVGYVSDKTDCDDTNAYIRPGAQEDCTNSVDENCDGILGDNNFSIAETHTNVYCGSTPDGSISITVSPAQNYTLVLWSNNVCCTTTQTNLQPGLYKVTVTNECGTTKTQAVTIQPSPTPALQVTMSGTHVKCRDDGNATITATPRDGCGSYTYLWSNNSTDATLSGLSGGFYSVVVTDACGCTQTGSFTVNEPANNLTIYVNTIITLLDGNYWVQVLPYGGTSPYQFRRNILTGGYTAWSNSNGFANVPPGNYTFEVQDQNGCTAQINQVLSPFTPPPGNKPGHASTDHTALMVKDLDPSNVDVRQSELAPGFTGEQNPAALIFPNPTDGELNIEWSGFAGKSASIQLVSSVGQLLRTLPVPDEALRVMTNVADLPAGVYFVKILSADKQVKALQFVKL